MPKQIFYEATNCRNQCFHCYCPAGSRGRMMMSPDQILDMTGIFQEMLKEEITIGILREPTLYPELLPLLKKAEKASWLGREYKERSLYTNGENLSETLLSELLPIMPKIRFTLYGTELMHDSLAGKIGAYGQIEDATKRAMSQGFQVEWRILATKGNEKEVAAIYEKGKELRLHELKVSGRYYLAGGMRNAYENIPTSKIVEGLLAKGIPYKLDGARPEREYAENPEILRNIVIRRLDLDHLYVDREFNVYPLNQIEDQTVIGNIKEGRLLLMDRLLGKVAMPESFRRAMQVSLPSLAEKFAKPYSEQLLTPQMLFEKYYWKMDI
ncbi:hypothetical protein SANA_26940 [Gottschalkiaceae bacterium SANA]|nr:hypothetical protein SANA_26940 [Gottschalkiaceae bacterium SANA]